MYFKIKTGQIQAYMYSERYICFNSLKILILYKINHDNVLYISFTFVGNLYFPLCLVKLAAHHQREGAARGRKICLLVGQWRNVSGILASLQGKQTSFSSNQELGKSSYQCRWGGVTLGWQIQNPAIIIP